MNLSPALVTALLAEPSITNDIASWNAGFSIHTMKPVPVDAPYPMIVTADDTTISDEDMLSSQMPVISRDVAIYGQVDKDYRAVERLGYAVREMFHRKKRSITVTGYKVVSIECTGPISAPTDDAKQVGRIVSLRVRLQPV